MTAQEIRDYVKSEKTRLYNQVEHSTDLMDDLDDYDELLKDILSMLDQLDEDKEIEKVLSRTDEERMKWVEPFKRKE